MTTTGTHRIDITIQNSGAVSTLANGQADRKVLVLLTALCRLFLPQLNSDVRAVIEFRNTDVGLEGQPGREEQVHKGRNV